MREPGSVGVTLDFVGQLHLQTSVGDLLFEQGPSDVCSSVYVSSTPRVRRIRTQTEPTPVSFQTGQMWLLRGRDPIGSRHVAPPGFPERVTKSKHTG